MLLYTHALVTARIVAFIPGASPPEVKKAIFLDMFIHFFC